MNLINDSLERGISLGKVASLCGVNRKTVLRWVQERLIPSFRLPRGHYRVLPEDLRAFLRQHGMPVKEQFAEAVRKTALLCDDDPQIRRLMRDLLHPHFDLEEATDGVEACIRLGARPPDLLILDMRMPRMDGIAVCRYLRSRPEYAGMKVIVVSAYLDRQIEDAGTGFAHAVLRKPFSSVELVPLCLRLTGLGVAPASAAAVEKGKAQAVQQ